MKKVMKKIIPLIIGFVILIAVLYFAGVEKIFSILSEVNIFYLILAALFYLVVDIFACFKLKLISKLSFLKLFFSHEAGMFLSNITPGRIGYGFTAYSIAKKEKKSISETLGAIGLIQGIMISTKIIVIVIAFVYFSFISKIPNYLFLSFVFPVLFVVLLIFILYTEKSKKVLLKIPILEKTVKYIDLMQESVKKINKKKIFYMVFLDLIGWFFYGFMFYFLAYSLNVNIDFLTCLMIHPLLSALLFIPVSPSALGIAESGSALIFGLLDVESIFLNVDVVSFGVSFVLLFRLVTILVNSIGIIDFRVVNIPKKLKDFF